jgi:hypothetical protein
VEFTPGFARTANSVAEICPIKEHTGEFIRGYFSDCDNFFNIFFFFVNGSFANEEHPEISSNSVWCSYLCIGRKYVYVSLDPRSEV